MAITFEKVLVLKNIPFFAEASELALSDLIAVCEEHTVKAGETIIAPGEENRFLFMILSGQVHMSDGDDLVAELGARQVFGETTVMSPAIIPYRVSAQTQTTFFAGVGGSIVSYDGVTSDVGEGIYRGVVPTVAAGAG